MFNPATSHPTMPKLPEIMVVGFSMAGFATYMGYLQFGVPFMGDDGNMRHTVSGLKYGTKFHEARRLARYATNDERRMKIMEIGGAHELVNMSRDARDNFTWGEALKALNEAVGALHQAKAISVIHSTPEQWILVYPSYKNEDHEIEEYKSNLLRDSKI